MLCAPIIASYTLYFFGVRPGATVNYGELLQVKPLAGTALNQADQTIFRIRQLRGKWVMAMVDSGKCDEQCQKKLYYMRQVRLTQHKEKDRVERLWLIDDGEVPAPEIVKDFEGVLHSSTLRTVICFQKFRPPFPIAIIFTSSIRLGT